MGKANYSSISSWRRKSMMGKEDKMLQYPIFKEDI